MKNAFTFLILLSCSWVSAQTSTTSEKKFKDKQAIGIDYNSWFELMTIADAAGNKFTTKAIYNGIGVGYDHTVYQSESGFGYNIGYVQGFGVAGKASETGTYYQKRAPWSAIRGGGRYFARINRRIDLGVALTALFRQNKWGDDSGFSPEASPNPITGMFIDSRWRLNYKLEVLQSIGTFAKDTGIVWRLGVNYTIN